VAAGGTGLRCVGTVVALRNQQALSAPCAGRQAALSSSVSTPHLYARLSCLQLALLSTLAINHEH
jgi:hypothetical protein